MTETKHEYSEASVERTGKDLKDFVSNPTNTFLVSFPRTGSHWLRMLMELYFERPSLVRIFFYPERTDYLTYHTHDLDGDGMPDNIGRDVQRSSVIYLYRNPVDTIYSQLKYYDENILDEERVVHWALRYGKHLDKWLHLETFTNHKTVLTYEGMKKDLHGEFKKLTAHFGVQLEKERLEAACKAASKHNLKKLVGVQRPKVIDLSDQYRYNRDMFTEKMGGLVWQTVLDGRQHLSRYFSRDDRAK